jgi:hypothetical protein
MYAKYMSYNLIFDFDTLLLCVCVCYWGLNSGSCTCRCPNTLAMPPADFDTFYTVLVSNTTNEGLNLTRLLPPWILIANPKPPVHLTDPQIGEFLTPLS